MYLLLECLGHSGIQPGLTLLLCSPFQLPVHHPVHTYPRDEVCFVSPDSPASVVCKLHPMLRPKLIRLVNTREFTLSHVHD